MAFVEQRVMLLAVLTAVGLLLGACARSSPDQLGASAQDWQSEGRIQVMDGDTWVVGSALVAVPPQATVVGNPQVGSVVRLTGKRTADGALRADSVQVVQDAVQPTARPTPAPTPVPVRQATVRPAIQTPRAPGPPAQAPGKRGREEDRDD